MNFGLFFHGFFIFAMAMAWYHFVLWQRHEGVNNLDKVVVERCSTSHFQVLIPYLYSCLTPVQILYLVCPHSCSRPVILYSIDTVLMSCCWGTSDSQHANYCNQWSRHLSVCHVCTLCKKWLNESTCCLGWSYLRTQETFWDFHPPWWGGMGFDAAFARLLWPDVMCLC